MNSGSLDTFPVEILDNIFGLVPASDKLAIREVSEQFILSYIYKLKSSKYILGMPPLQESDSTPNLDAWLQKGWYIIVTNIVVIWNLFSFRCSEPSTFLPHFRKDIIRWTFFLDRQSMIARRSISRRERYVNSFKTHYLRWSICLWWGLAFSKIQPIL